MTCSRPTDWFRQVQNLPPTPGPSKGRLVAELPASCAWADALPDDQRWLAPPGEPLRGGGRAPGVVRLDAPGVTGWAWLRGLDLEGAPTCRAWPWRRGGDDRLPVAGGLAAPARGRRLGAR